MRERQDLCASGSRPASPALVNRRRLAVADAQELTASAPSGPKDRKSTPCKGASRAALQNFGVGKH